MPFFLMKNMWQIEDDIKPAYAAGRLFGEMIYLSRELFSQSPLASRILLVSFLVLFEKSDRLQWIFPLFSFVGQAEPM